MPQEPRDFAQWTKSVERRLQQALRAGQSPQAVRLARDLQRVRDEVKDIEVGSAPQPAAPVELVTETRVLPDLTGAPRGEVSVSFAPVTVDVNANPIEVDRYELWLETVEPEAEEEEEPGDGDFGWEEDDSWRTNLVTDTESEYWRSRNTPRTKQVADLQEGEDFVAGDRIRFSVTVDTFGVNPRPGDFERLMHSVRMSAFNARSVEDAVWQMTVLPTSNEGDSSDRTVETYTLEGEVPEGTTRITAHYAGTIRAGHIEFINPVLFNLSETKPEPPETQASKMVSTSLEPRLSYSPLDVDGEYEVKVRAVAGTQAGPMSATRRVKIEADRTPPPIPSALELSSSGATVMASWDLLAGTGDPMPSDFSHTEVAYGYLPPPTEIAGSITLLFSQYIFETPQQPSDADFDGTWYFRHRAVDTSGNKSPWSATSSIVPKQLVDTAAMQFEFDEFNRERIEPLEASINDEVRKAQDAVQEFRDEWDANWDPEAMADLEARQGTLETELTASVEGANRAIQEFRDEWDENWDPEAIAELERRQGALESDLSTGLSEANQAISSFREEWDESGWDPEAMGQLEARQDVLEGTIETGLGQVSADLQVFRTEWDENWDPDAISGLVERADDLEDNLQQGLANAEQSYRSLAITGPRNVVADQDFETLSDGDYRAWESVTEAWHTTGVDWSQRPMVRIGNDFLGSGNYSITYGGNGPANCVLPCVPGETFKLRFQVARYAGWSDDDDYRAQFRWTSADGTGVGWTTGNWGGIGNQGWFEMEATAPEGAERFYLRWRKVGEAQGARGFGTVSVLPMTTGDLTVDGTMLARHVDMEDFTADAGFIDNAFVNLIQGKMANFDQALIGGNLLKDRSITTRHLTVADTTDFAPDPIDYAAAWSLIRASVVANTAAFEGAAIALDNTSTSDSGARGPILPVHPGDEIYVGAQIGWNGSAPTSGRVYLRMEWFEDATSSRETFTNVVSTLEASGWIEGTTTVPNYATHARFYIYTPSNSVNPGVRRIRSSKVRVQTGGELIVDGSIKARHGDFADITASDAFLDHAMVNLIQGRMANFDEAIIGGALLKNNSVATRHLTVTNTEDLFPQEWMDDIHDSVYVFSPAGSSLANSNFNARFFQEDPVGVDGNVEWTTTTLQGDQGFQVWPSENSGVNQRIAFRLGPGKGVMVRPGEQYTFRCRVRDANDGSFFDVRMALADVETGEGVLQADAPGRSIRGLLHGSSSELVWTFTIPSNFPRMWMVPSFHSGANSSGSARTILRPALFRAMDGKLIVDGSIKAGSVDMVDFTADAGFIDNAFVHLIQGKMANFDQAIIGEALLKDNSVTVGKLSVIPDVTDYAPDPSEFPELWDLTGASIVASTGNDDNPSNVGFRFNQRSGNTQVRGPVRPVTPGKKIRFRGRYTGWGTGTSGATINVRMEWSGDLSSGRDGFATFVSISTSASLGWYSGTVTVPEWAEYGRLYFYQGSNSGRDMGFRGSIQCEPMVGSVLIEDGAVKAEHVDSVSLTASNAFLDNAMVNLIQGRMANFDEALIGGNLLKDGSISTRHLTIGNTEELWNNSWMDDLEDTAYIFSPGGAVGSTSFRNRFRQENPSSLASSSFDWRYTTLQGDRGIQIWPANSTSNQRAAFRLGPGKGILVRPGEQYTFRARIRDTNDGNFFALRMALFDYESGDGVSQSDCPSFDIRGIVHGSSGESVWTFVIPDNYPRMWMVPSIHSGNNSSSGARTVLRPQLFKSADGRMIVDGLLQATTGELQELFFDTAVGNSIAAGAGRFLTIETGNLASNAVTADKISFGSLNGALITGLQIQTHTNNRGVKITSAGIRAFNSSGTEVFTVNASNGNVSARGGTFTGASFEGGSVEGTTITGGQFRTASSIFGSSDGGVRIRTLSGGGGQIQVTDGNANSVLNAGRDGLTIRGDITADNVALAGELRVGVGGAGEGGLTPVGDRLDIRGRVPELDNMSGETTFMAMTTPYSAARDWYSNFNTGTLKLVRITYPKSAPRGARLPLAIMNINGSNSPGRGASASITRNRTNAYFNLAMGYSDSITTGANPQFAITILSTWGQTTPGGFVGT